MLNAPVTEHENDRLTVHVNRETPRSLRNKIRQDDPFHGRLKLPVQVPEIYLVRTHPIVEGLASWVMDTALDPKSNRNRRPLAARCGVSMVNGISELVTVLLLRMRHHLKISSRNEPMLAEEIKAVAFTGTSESPHWLENEMVEDVLKLPPAGNVPNVEASEIAKKMIAGLRALRSHLEQIAETSAKAQQDAHVRVRQSARAAGQVSVEPVLPVDILGAYAVVPVSRAT